MTLYDELYFEITAHGKKSDLRNLVSFFTSGELDSFFEVSSDYIIFDDGYVAAGPDIYTEVIFTNDDYGIEIEEFDVDEFLDVFCKAAKKLDVYGCFYDVDEDEFRFLSEKGNSYYINAKNAMLFNDELDEVRRDEEVDDEE